MYANSVTVSHLIVLHNTRYDKKTIDTKRSAPKKSTQTSTCTFGTTICAEDAIPAKSAPTLNVLAATTAMAIKYANGTGTDLRIFAANPRPVTMPMRAHMP